MTPLEELRALYEQWRLLTEEEGAAIDREDWTQVAHCQAAKARLQAHIVDLSGLSRAEVSQGQLRPVLEALLKLEHANQERLAKHRQQAEAQQQDLIRSSRHLRKLHHSYVPPARAHWQSYS
jgi:hypothetical protein